jgi:hypothetical protein
MKTSKPPDNFCGINTDCFSSGKTVGNYLKSFVVICAIENGNNNIFIADIKIGIAAGETLTIIF